jgi:AcrR family transcriptional regulator
LRRWRRADWIELAVLRLKGGPSAVTLEQLCAAAGRSRGSFYHHFESIDVLLVELARRWRDTETEAIASAAADAPDPMSRLASMVKLTDHIDHRLERAVRVIALSDTNIAEIVEGADARREEVLGDLLLAAYGLEAGEAASAARLFHALHLAAVMRSSADIKGYSRSVIRHLAEWLPKSGTR